MLRKNRLSSSPNKKNNQEKYENIKKLLKFKCTQLTSKLPSTLKENSLELSSLSIYSFFHFYCSIVAIYLEKSGLKYS